MDVQEQDRTENDTAIRIRRIREAFAEARAEGGEKDAPKEPHSPTWNNWGNFTSWGNWNNSYT